MRVVIVGAGAVGLGMASGLLAGGADGVIVCRPGSVDEIRRDIARNGLGRSGVLGAVAIPAPNVRVTDSLASALDLLADPVDWILVCTKSHASPAVARELGRVTAASGCTARIALFQNGWGNAEHFAARVAPERVFNARVITGFRRTRPGGVEVTVHADAVRVGSLFGRPAAEAAGLCNALTAGGIPCEPADEIAADLWAKLLYNCALNPLGALLGVPYGDLGEREATRSVMGAVAREVFEVMEKAGYRTHWSSADAWLAELYQRLLPATAEHESSMLQDLRAGRRSEIDALSGAVAELGDRLGVDVRCNRALRDLVRGIEEREA